MYATFVFVRSKIIRNNLILDLETFLDKFLFIEIISTNKAKDTSVPALQRT